MNEVLSPFCILTCRVNNYVSNQRKSIKWRYKNTANNNFLRFLLVNATPIFNSVDCYWLKFLSSLKNKMDFVSLKNTIWNKGYFTFHLCVMRLVVSSLSHAVPQWRHGRFSSNFGPQPAHSRIYCSVRTVIEVGSVFTGLFIQGSGLFAALAP